MDGLFVYNAYVALVTLSLLCCILPFTSTTFTKHQYNITYKSNNEPSRIGKGFLLNVTRLIVAFDSVCIYTNNNGFLSHILEIISCANGTVVVNDFSENKLTNSCAICVLLGDFTDEELEDYLAHYITSFQKSLFLVSNRNTTSLRSWKSLTTHEVLYANLQKTSLYLLSPEFSRPRHFLPTSVAEVTARRNWVKLKNLQGQTVSVGITKYPPTLIFMEAAKGGTLVVGQSNKMTIVHFFKLEY